MFEINPFLLKTIAEADFISYSAERLMKICFLLLYLTYGRKKLAVAEKTTALLDFS
jgi:hypothetical protein